MLLTPLSYNWTDEQMWGLIDCLNRYSQKLSAFVGFKPTNVTIAENENMSYLLNFLVGDGYITATCTKCFEIWSLQSDSEKSAPTDWRIG